MGFDPQSASKLLARLERFGLDRADALAGVSITVSAKETLDWPGNLGMYRIESVVRRSERESVRGHEISGLLSVLSAGAAPFLFVLLGHANRLEVLIGTRTDRFASESFHAALAGVLPGARVARVNLEAVLASLRGHRSAATLIGAPARTARSIADGIGPALTRESMALVISATPVAPAAVAEARWQVLEEILAATPYLRVNQAFVQRSRETVTSEHSNPALERYVRGLEGILDEMALCSDAGMWRVSATLAAESDAALARMQALSCSAWMGEGANEPRVEPVRVLRLTPELRHLALELHLLAPMSFTDDQAAGAKVLEPLLGGLVTHMNGQRLASVCALPSEEYAGFGVHLRSRFKVNPRPAAKPDLQIGEVLDLGRVTGSECRVSKQELCKHAMVAGVTGSGKTTTCMSIILQLSAGDEPTPFLVIEPAKREYRALLGHPLLGRMLVFTLGEEREAPLRLNPFEVPTGASIQVHLDLLRAAFQAAFPMYPPMPQVLERCLHEVYADHGWDLLRGQRRGGTGTPDDFPTLTDLYAKIDPVVDAMGYDVRITQDIKAALKARVGSLRIGGKGAFLDCWRSTPLGELLVRPVVFELEGIADDEEKAFVLALLLMRLYEYRVAAARAGDVRSELRHVTLFEEAHRLLARVADQAGNPDAVNTKAKAVEVFANMLSEIRAYGEGIVVAEQIPSKLAPDVVKNTNLKIAHRLVAAEDRELVGTSMKMSPEQREDLALLSTGEAVVFCEGFEGPCLLRVEANAVRPNDWITPKEREASRTAWSAQHEDSHGKYATCSACPAKCLHIEAARDLASRPSLARLLDTIFPALAVDPEAFPEMFENLRRRVTEAEPVLRGHAIEIDDILACILVGRGEGQLARLTSSADTRSRDKELWGSYTKFVSSLFGDRGRSALDAITKEAARRVGRRLRELTSMKAGPFSACDVACRNVCMVRGVGALIAADPQVAADAAVEYARDGDGRFARVRHLLRTRARTLTGAPESTLNAFATCAFIHLCSDSGVATEDARWAASQLAEA